MEKSAKAGDVEAQFTVGNAYLTGDGVKQNLKKATQWLFKAAQAGQADAIKALCTYYSDALEQVAAAGNADAQFALANFYETGNGVAQNQAKALELYGSAAAQGIAEAKPKVLGSYNAGIVTLADAGDIDAATQVADYLFNGTGGATKDEAAAANYYAKAYMAGNKSAGTKLTTMYRAYLEGRGVPRNENLGNLWLAKAASAGIDEAMNKFYNTYSKYLENAANEGDVKAMVALARLRKKHSASEGLEWYIRAIKAGNTSIYKEFDDFYEGNKDSYSEVFKAADGTDCVLRGLDALKKQAFDQPIVCEGEIMKIYRFDERGDQGDYRINYETVKILDPNMAYYLALYEYDSEYDSDIATTLLKRLMNEFGHEGAKQKYDNYYFKYDYESYNIGRVGRYSIVGFNGLPETVMINDKKFSSQVPTPEELQMLLDSLPDFAINKDAIRVIRDFTAMENERIRWVVDIYYLPGMWTYGPDSYFEMSAEYEAYDRELMHYMSLKMSNPYKHRFGHFAGNKTEFNVTVTGTETREIAKAKDLDVDTCIYESGYPVKGITTVNLEWQGEIKNLKIFSDLEEYRYGNGSSSNWSGNYFTVVDGDTLGLTRNFNSSSRLELEHYTIKGQDGIEYSLMPNKYHESIDSNLPYELGRRRWYRMTYPKPDGKKMEVLIPDYYIVNYYHKDKMTFDNIKENLNAAFLDSIFNEVDDAVVIAENGEMIPYKKGILASEYNAQEEQRKEAEDNAKWEAFWEDMAKQYGKSQADLLRNSIRNSNRIVVKGLDIRVLTHYTVFMYKEQKTNIGAVEFYRTDADGYGVYIFHRPTAGAEIWIRTKNYKIYDWTIYSND